MNQIFIGNKIGYLGNGATNVVFPITALAHELSMLLGCGCAAYMNLNMGKGEHKEAKKGVGNTIVSLVMLAVILPILYEIFISPLLNIFGATTANKLLAVEYGCIIIAGFPFVIMY
ncbi:MAG: MATE family efflux transporter [Ruminococcus flavefaciens]|nr:MATE family efflux transporter [Ruminococcus flavefaciens]MCM1061146.1 MATE family efflux transporter [Eubacterium sp.]